MCLTNLYPLCTIILLLSCHLSLFIVVLQKLSQPQWKAVMREEMAALEKNRTWDLVDLPGNKVPIGCKWVYTIKPKPNETVDHYKVG